MLRRLAPSLLVAAFALAACTGAPAISDPKEIITQGIEATTALKSFHMSLAVDGTFSVPEGGSFPLNGTTLDGDFDLETKAGKLTFGVPAFLGLTGEVIVIGSDTYVKTSMTGETWSKSTSDSDGDSLSEAMDPEAALAEVRAFLDKEGVEAEKLDDVECGERTCYAVRLTIPSTLLADAGDEVDMDPTETLGDSLVVDLRFDRESLWLTEISTGVDSETVGAFNATLTFSAFDEAVTVNPPPADQVTEGELPLPL